MLSPVPGRDDGAARSPGRPAGREHARQRRARCAERQLEQVRPVRPRRGRPVAGAAGVAAVGDQLGAPGRGSRQVSQSWGRQHRGDPRRASGSARASQRSLVTVKWRRHDADGLGPRLRPAELVDEVAAACAERCRSTAAPGVRPRPPSSTTMPCCCAPTDRGDHIGRARPPPACSSASSHAAGRPRCPPGAARGRTPPPHPVAVADDDLAWTGWTSRPRRRAACSDRTPLVRGVLFWPCARGRRRRRRVPVDLRELLVGEGQRSSAATFSSSCSDAARADDERGHRAGRAAPTRAPSARATARARPRPRSARAAARRCRR